MKLNNADHRNHKVNTYDLSREYGIGWASNTNREFYFDLAEVKYYGEFAPQQHLFEQYSIERIS